MTGMAEIEVNPQEEMTNPQDMKVFERLGFPEDSVSFCTLCGGQSSSFVFTPNRVIVWGPLQWQAPVETLCFSVFPELSAQVRRPDSCTSCIPAHMDASITRTGRDG